MKIIRPAILFILIFSISNVKASHLIGGNVSYKSMGSNKYEIYIIFYRDCSAIPIGKPTLLLQNVKGGSSMSISSSNISEIFVSDVTPLCKKAGKPCSPQNTTSGFGFEKHIYKATVDLSTWKSAGACQVLIGAGQCCRPGTITTGAANQDYWVWSMLDLCNGSGNNSASFGEEPLMLVNCNEVVKYNPAATDPDDDSLAYELVDPLQNSSSKTTWAGGFSSKNPFTVYWPSWYDKTKGPNPNTNPPIGFYFNNLTGEMVFTPTDCSEITISSVRVSEYRKDTSGKYMLVGYVTRDVQTFAKSSTGNNLPLISSNQNIYIADNIKTCFTVSTTDSEFKPPTGPSVTNDTTNIVLLPFAPYNSKPASLNITNPKAKLKSALVCWEPKGLARSQPYQMVLKATDNHCTYYGSSHKLVNIYVQKSDNLAWLEGYTFYDKNKNCELDSNENLLPNQKIFFGPGNSYAIESDSSGRFESIVPPGNFSFKIFNVYGEFVCTKNINIAKGNSYKFNLGALPKMHITGTVYQDNSKNCKFETTEPKWADHIVYTEPGNYTSTTDANGKYDLNIPAGDYKIRYKPLGANYFVKCSAIPFVSSGMDTLFTNQNIAVFDSSNIADASSKVISAYTYRRGGDHEITVVVKNNGSQSVSSGNLWIKFNKKLKFVSATSYVLKTDSTVKWNFTNLTAGKELRFYTVLNADASTCQLNDTMTLFSWLDTAGISKDKDLSNNVDKHKIRISAKTEPNVKEEILTNGYSWREGNKLRYYIQFRNTGTKTVNDVTVTDTLPFPVSGSSFQMLGASHANTYSINNNVLKVNFTGINLPDSTTDKIKSKGYFEFSADIDKRVNTEIKFFNKAEIQFDAAKAVKTNNLYNTYTSYVSTGKTNTVGYCIGDTLKVSYSSKFQFGSGNKFKLVLSNSDGIFDNKSIAIDSFVSSSLSGNFKTKLTSAIGGGSNYKTKVVSTNPYSLELSNGVSNSFKIFTSIQKPIISVKDTMICGKDSILITINSLLDSLKIYDRKTLLASVANVPTLKIKIAPGKHYLTATRTVSSSCRLTSDTLVFRNDTVPDIDLICTSHSNYYACFGDTLKLKSNSAFTYGFYDEITNNLLKQNNTGVYSYVFDYDHNDVYVIGKSRYGCADTSEVFSIYMRDPLPPDVKFSEADLTLCKSQSLTVTGSGFFVRYQLYKNNKSFLDTFPSSISTSGIKDKDSLKLKGTDIYGCSNFSKSYGFKVLPDPDIKMTCTDPDLTICDGVNSNMVTFNVSGGNTYKLYKNGIFLQGMPGSAASPYGIKDKDYFYCEGTTIDGCKNNSDTITISVRKPVTTLIINKGGPACDGDSILFDLKGGNSYELFKNKVIWQTLSSQKFVVRSMTQNDTVYARGTDSFGCKANSAKYGFNIIKSPVLTITNKDADNSHCDGDEVILTLSGVAKHDLYKNGTLWKPGLGTSVTFNDVLDKDEIYITGTAANGCKGISNIIKFAVWPIPAKPIIFRTGNDLSSNYTTGNQWFSESAKITGAINQKYTPSKFDNYYVQHTSAKGCVSPISDKYSFTSGVSKLDLPGLKIYPNPAMDHITLETGETGHYKVKLIDITGKLIKEDIFIGKKFEWNFRIEKGIYQLVLINEKGQIKTQSLEIL